MTVLGLLVDNTDKVLQSPTSEKWEKMEKSWKCRFTSERSDCTTRAAKLIEISPSLSPAPVVSGTVHT